MKKKISTKNLNPQAPVEKLLEAQQLELGSMNLLSLLQFGSQTLLKDAIAQEITQYLGRDFYKHVESGQEAKGQRNGYRATTVDTPVGQIKYDRPLVAYAPDFVSQTAA